MKRFGLMVFLYFATGFGGVPPVQAQETVWFESFETDGAGVRYTVSSMFGPPDSLAGVDDYFFRTDGDAGVMSTESGPYSDFDGVYFWAAEDVDDDAGDGDDFKLITFAPVDVSGYTNLRFEGLFGAGNAGGPDENAFDRADSMAVNYSVDGGQTFHGGVRFSFVDNGSSFAQPLAHDADFDGHGEGQQLAPAMQAFGFDLPEAGSVILQVVVRVDSGSEEVAFDYFRLVGDPAGSPGDPVAGFGISDTTLVFADTEVGSVSERVLTISSTGSGVLQVTAVSVEGADAGAFSASFSTAAVPAGGDTAVVVRFAPGFEGAATAEILISHDAPGSPARVGLAGTGVVAPTPAAGEWAVDLVVSNSGAGVDTLRFGLAEGATDGLDVALGEANLPPVPPLGVFDVRFEVVGALGSGVDLRDVALENVTWELQVQAGSGGFGDPGGYPVRLAWDRAAFPEDGFFHLQDAEGRVAVDMRAQDSYDLTDTSVNRLRILYRTRSTFTFELGAGWHLISLPVAPDDGALNTLFADALWAYAFSNGYRPAEELAPCTGYWVELASGGSYTVSGVPQFGCDYSLVSAWNLIGAPLGGASVSAIGQDPGGILVSVFGFSDSYAQVTELAAGSGYWVNLSAPGTLSVRALESGGGAAKPVVAVRAEDVLRVEAGALVQEIYLGVAPEAVMGLPPPPPGRAFDARVLLGGRDAWQAPALPGKYPLYIQAPEARLAWEAGAGNWDLIVNGRVIGLEGDGALAVNPAVDEVFVRRRVRQPEVYALERNSPNPFNPSTEISYRLAESGQTVLEVFNAVGQRVRVLVREFQEAGAYRVVWDGRDERGRAVSSGVYVYRLASGAFTRARRMLLLK